MQLDDIEIHDQNCESDKHCAVITCDELGERAVSFLTKGDDEYISVIHTDAGFDKNMVFKHTEDYPQNPVFLVAGSKSVHSGKAGKIYSQVLASHKEIIWPILLVAADSEYSSEKLSLLSFKYVSVFCRHDYEDVAKAMSDFIVTVSRCSANYSVNKTPIWHYHFSEYILDHIYSNHHDYHYYAVLDSCRNRVIGCPEQIAEPEERLLMGSNMSCERFRKNLQNIDGTMHLFHPVSDEVTRESFERCRQIHELLNWEEKDAMGCEWDGWKENLFTAFVTVRV